MPSAAPFTRRSVDSIFRLLFRNPLRANTDRTRQRRVRHLGKSDISFRLQADHSAIAETFSQVRPAFSVRTHQSLSGSNREPNHADFVSWHTHSRWRVQPPGRYTRRRRAGETYRKLRPRAARHARASGWITQSVVSNCALLHSYSSQITLLPPKEVPAEAAVVSVLFTPTICFIEYSSPQWFSFIMVDPRIQGCRHDQLCRARW